MTTAATRTATTIFIVSDRLDRSTSPLVGSSLERMLRCRPRHLEIDLMDCAFIDAAGLRVIIDACAHAASLQVSFELVHAEGDAADLILGLAKRIGPAHRAQARTAAVADALDPADLIAA